MTQIWESNHRYALLKWDPQVEHPVIHPGLTVSLCPVLHLLVQILRSSKTDLRRQANGRVGQCFFNPQQDGNVICTHHLLEHTQNRVRSNPSSKPSSFSLSSDVATCLLGYFPDWTLQSSWLSHLKAPTNVVTCSQWFTTREIKGQTQQSDLFLPLFIVYRKSLRHVQLTLIAKIEKSVQDLISNCPTYLFGGCYSDSYYASSDIPMYPTHPPLRLSMWGRHKVDKLGSNSGYADRPVVKAGNGTFRLKRKKTSSIQAIHAGLTQGIALLSPVGELLGSTTGWIQKVDICWHSQLDTRTSQSLRFPFCAFTSQQPTERILLDVHPSASSPWWSHVWLWTQVTN